MTNGHDRAKTPEHWRRIEALYEEVRALPTAERAAMLASACAEDPALADEVQSLLAQCESAAGFLGVPPIELAARAVASGAALGPGQRLGAFEIVDLLGAGGMGEVYRARDTRLNRSVAIKVLPSHLSSDPERRARFDREAKAVSSLNHPHICTLYDVGHQDGIDYLVMELVEGETLAARLRKGPLPLELTLRTAIDIADALDKAHRHGVIHRDLKPGNVMLTKSGAKLLDFGLAKRALTKAPAAASALSAQPTESTPADRAPLTAEGSLLGTFQYMAPEQIEGKEADARADLWALGCVMYEMATGKPAFVGKSQASLISAILITEPPAIAEVRPLAPLALERIVRVCLAKDPDDRMQTAHDVMQALKWIGEAGVVSPATSANRVGASWRRILLTTGLLAICLVLGVVAERVLRDGNTPPFAVVRSSLDVRPAPEVNTREFSGRPSTPAGSRTAIAWTPDGRAIAFIGLREAVKPELVDRTKLGTQIYVRDLDQDQARPLQGTEGAMALAVSADGQRIAFWTPTRLPETSAIAIKTVPLRGGPVTQRLGAGRMPLTGLTYGTNGDLFYADFRAIWRLPEEGAPAVVTTQPQPAGENYILPALLPGAHAMLYTLRRRGSTWGDEQIVAQVLATGERKVLLNDAVDARYVPGGYLVFMRRGTLFGVEFDLSRLEVRGHPVPLQDNVAQALTGGIYYDLTGAGQFSVSPAGALAYVAGPVVPNPDARLVAVDRSGRVSPLPAAPRSYSGRLSISPDGTRLAVQMSGITEMAPWIVDIARGTVGKLSSDGEASWSTWSPDGQDMAFVLLRGGRNQLARQRADGTAPPEILAPDVGSPSTFTATSSWTPDGRKLAFHNDGDLWVATVNGSKASIEQVTKTPELEGWPAFSPDGRWMAYSSALSGRAEVYVRPFPGPGASQQVSKDGGLSPWWNPAGGEMFFIEASRSTKANMMAVEIRTSPALAIGTPHPLFEFTQSDLGFNCYPVLCYAVSPDGQRFFVTRSIPAEPRPPVTQIQLILNWAEEVKAKVKAGQAK